MLQAQELLKCFAGLESLLLASLTAITSTILEQQPPPKCIINTLQNQYAQISAEFSTALLAQKLLLGKTWKHSLHCYCSDKKGAGIPHVPLAKKNLMQLRQALSRKTCLENYSLLSC